MKVLATGLLEDIVQRLVNCLSPDQIILFGSHSYGTPNQDSDVDLLVIVSGSDEPRYRRAQKAYGTLWGVGVPIDVLVMTQAEVKRSENVKASLVYQALNRGKVLYG
jgi:uncharacterized protein